MHAYIDALLAEKQREFQLPDQMYTVETDENAKPFLKPAPNDKQREPKLPVLTPGEIKWSSSKNEGNFEEAGMI